MTPRRIAYADPPYIGQAKKHYSHDPLCAEVDHAALIEQLAEYDGWALSMSAAMYSLKEIIALAPDDCRVAAWVKPFASFKKGVDPAYTWEPILFKTCRKWDKGQNTVRDHISEPITMKKGLAGAKPEKFCFWLFELLGCSPDDELTDLFPGTGIISQSWEIWKARKLKLPVVVQLCRNPVAVGEK